jgi:hypothetical protein
MFIVVGVWIGPGALGAIALAVLLGLRAPWWGVLLTVAACGALAVAAALRIRAWSERRGTLATAQWPVQRLRAEAVERDVPAAFPAAGARPAIGPVYNFNFYGPAGDTHAAIIRKAITGPPGDAAIEGK